MGVVGRQGRGGPRPERTCRLDRQRCGGEAPQRAMRPKNTVPGLKASAFPPLKESGPCDGTVAVLLRAGADPRAKSHLGMTALMMAAMGKCPEALAILLPVSCLNLKDDKDLTALDYAVAENRKEEAKVLLEAGARLPKDAPTKEALFARWDALGRSRRIALFMQALIPRLGRGAHGAPPGRPLLPDAQALQPAPPGPSTGVVIRKNESRADQTRSVRRGCSARRTLCIKAYTA